ncbi:hypothetical protein [Larkinella rosea]|uniref:Uncharacterized protein n=1 Tax=Larkinella rosea TaxID=2025312 RepID=A0A3P1BCW0_9BACT|nr:hypothetical protein [Larkinella rosea]RRA98612.1 hypothetical protein EHT25_26770 [Larkinella rosea]
MTSITALDILFDDFALLEQRIGRQQLIATSVNANCDCDSSPARSTDGDRMDYVFPTSDSDSINYLSTLRHGFRDPY